MHSRNRWFGTPFPLPPVTQRDQPGSPPGVTPQSWKGRLRPKAGEHVWGKSQRCARKSWILPSSTSVSSPHPAPRHPRCSPLHVRLPGSQVTDRVPESPTPRRSLVVLSGVLRLSTTRVFPEKVLGLKKKSVYVIVIFFSTTFLRDRAAITLSPLVFLYFV